MSKTINIKGIANWIYSLLGVWWVIAIPIFIVGYIIGIFNLFLIGVLCVVSFILWVKTSDEEEAKISFATDILSDAVSYFKIWWSHKPTFIK